MFKFSNSNLNVDGLLQQCLLYALMSNLLFNFLVKLQDKIKIN